MPHLACLNEDNIVIETIMLGNDDCFNENQQLDLTTALSAIPRYTNVSGNWIFAEHLHEDGGYQASVGKWYSQEHDLFAAPKRYASWVINPNTRDWEPPFTVPGPFFTNGETTEKMWSWDESQINWVLIDVPENHNDAVNETCFN